jgi:hypothetical protein
MNQLEVHTNLGMKGHVVKIEAFKGIKVRTFDPLRPDLDDFQGPLLPVLEFPGTRRILQESDHPDANPNKILTAGRNVMATQSGWMNYCQVGSGTSTPTAGQTGLDTRVNGTNTLATADIWGAKGSRPFYGFKRRVYRHDEGDAAGILNEIGIGWAASGAALIARHRTVNSIFEETAISVLSDEFLDVTYELRYYPPLVDVTGTITLDGNVFDTITTASEVTNGEAWGENIGELMGQFSEFSSDWNAWTGEPGDITQGPNGTAASCDNANQFNEAYSPNSYEIVMVCNTGAGGWNLSGGFRTLRFKSTAGWFQCRYGQQGGDEKVQKTSSFTMQIKHTLSWSELLSLFALPATFGVTGSSATLTHNP